MSKMEEGKLPKCLLLSSYVWVLATLATGFELRVVPTAAQNIPHATMCHICDDVSGQPCISSEKHFQVCGGITPYCLTILNRSTGTSSELTKSCATEETCSSLWWHSTRLNPACNQHDVSHNQVKQGEICHFCCSAASDPHVYCNEEIYPTHLVNDSAASKPTTAGTTTATTTTTTTTTVAPTTVTTKPVRNRPPVCLVCTEDTKTGEMCNEGSDFKNCPLGQFCLTSVFRQPGGYRMERKCGTRDECYKEWWLKTSPNKECFHQDLLKAHNGSDTRPVECHFCCTVRAGTSHDAYCSEHSQEVVPHNLLIFNTTTSVSPCEVCDKHGCRVENCPSTAPYCLNTVVRHQSRVVVQKRCTSVTECHSKWWGQTRLKTVCLSNQTAGVSSSTCHYCCHSDTGLEVCNRPTVPDTVLHFDNNNHVTTVLTSTLFGTVTNRPSHQTTHRSTTAAHITSTQPSARSTTAAHRSTTATHRSTTAAHITSTQHSTISTSAATSRATVVTTTTAVPTQSPNGSWCMECEDDPVTGKNCSTAHVTECAFWEPYCINTVVITASGLRRTIKRCATDPECYDDWWLLSRHDQVCLPSSNTSRQSQGPLGSTCNYCCQSSSISDICNDSPVPKLLIHYNETVTPAAESSPTPPHSTPTSHVRINVTRSAGSTSHSSPSSALKSSSTSAGTPIKTQFVTNATVLVTFPSTMVTTTTEPTSGGSIGLPECYVCTVGCPFLQDDLPCRGGYCMTSITDDSQYSRTMMKSCVSEKECYEKWWQETSDKDICLEMLKEGNMPSGTDNTCHFCCVGENCNDGITPGVNSLYDGSRWKG